MTQIALVGDTLTSFGGTVEGPGGLTQFADGFVVSIVGDIISPHMHGITLVTGATIIEGSPDTFCDGKPLARIGDACSCSCILVSGDQDAFCL